MKYRNNFTWASLAALAIACSSERDLTPQSRLETVLKDGDNAFELVPDQNPAVVRDTRPYLLRTPAEAWVNLITSPEMRGTSEISKNPTLSWSLQKYKTNVRPMMITKFDVEMVVNPPASGVNATLIFQNIVKDILAANQKNQSVLVKINSGNYVFNSLKPGVRDRSPAVNLAGLTRVKLTGSNPLDPPNFIFTNPHGEAIAIENSKTLEVSNITVNYEYPSTYGQVSYLGKSLGNGVIDSPELFNPSTASALGNPLDVIGSIFSYNTSTNTWYSGVHANHVTFEASEKPVKRNSNSFFDQRLSVFPSGDDVMIMHTRVGFAHAIYAKGRGNQDIAIRAIKIHSYPNMGVILAGGRGFWLDGVKIEPAAGKLTSGRADGIHIFGIQGDLLIENCSVSGQADDGLNVHGTAYSIASLAASGSIGISGPTPPEVGDRLALLSIGNRPLYSATIKTVSNVSTNNYDVQLDWGPCDSQCRTNLFKELPSEASFKNIATRGDAVRIGIAYSLNLASSRYVVRNNIFFKSGARGIIVEAPNGTVDSNQIKEVAGSAIAIISTNSYYLSGLGAVNVRISNSSITDTTFSKVVPSFPLEAAISVMTPGPSDAYPLLQSIVIRDNLSNGSGLAFGSVLRGTNILFKGNRATNFGLQLAPGTANDRILLKSSHGVTVLDR